MGRKGGFPSPGSREGRNEPAGGEKDAAVWPIAGFRRGGKRGIGAWAAGALAMMLAGAVGQGLVPPQYFGVVERFSVFAAVGFCAVCGIFLFRGFGLRAKA